MKYKPRALLLMGIAAGIRGKVKIGDVVLSERVVAYEPAALAKAEDGTDRTEHRPDIDRTPHSIMQDVVHYRPEQRRLEDVFRRIGGEFPMPPCGKEEEYARHVATMLSAKQATIGSGEKLLRNPEKIKALRDVHGKLEVAEMEAAGLVNAARRPNIPWLVVRGISDFGDEFKDDRFHTLASKAAAAVLVDFIVHGLDVGPPPPPPGWNTAQQASAQWQEETRDVIGRDVRIPRDDLKQRVMQSIREERVTVLLGDSGAGKSALVKAIHQAGSLPEVTLILHAQEAATLVTSHALDAVLKDQRKGEQLLFVLDGLDRVAGAEAMQLVARALRALDLSSAASPWRLLLICQSASWERARQELTSLNVPSTGAKCIIVDPFDKSEVEQVAKEVQDIAPVLLREDLRPVMGRPKVLDLVACAAAEVGLPDVSQWVGESSLIEWAWDKFIRGGSRGDQHARLLQELAARQADNWLFAIPLAEMSTPDAALITDLAQLGILIRRYDTVQFAHDLYADYARQRYLMSFFYSRRFEDLKSRLTNPLWHRAIRLVGLHLLEYRDGERIPDVEGWRQLVRTFDERVRDSKREKNSEDENLPSAGVDLLLEGIAFAAQPGTLLDSINDDLVADRGALLRSFLFRFNQAAVIWVPLRYFAGPLSGDISPNVLRLLDQPVRLPIYTLWSRFIEWAAKHAKHVLSCAPDDFIDAAECWLESIHFSHGENLFKAPHARLLAHMVVDLAERTVAEGEFYSYSEHSRCAKNRVRLYQMMLLCGWHEGDRVRTLARVLSGIEGPASPRSRPRRRSVLPPEYAPSVKKPLFWPNGPKSEPDQQFRRAAMTMPGAEWLVAIDPKFASEVFLALLIEVPDPERGGTDNLRDSFHFDSWRVVRPPFWDFPPAHCLWMKDPIIGLEFVIQVADFATDRWAENWPHVPRHGSIFDKVQANAPTITLTIGGLEREYVGDARVLEWHQGGGQGPDAAAAALMSLEHWLYDQDEKETLDAGVLAEILSKTHSVAVLGVLFELALKNPKYLLGPLEPLMQCAEIHLWGQLRMDRVRVSAAMAAWHGQSQRRAKAAVDWHSMQHRGREFMRIVASLFVQRNFDWPPLDQTRRKWIELAERTFDERLRDWIRDAMLPCFDKDNWRFIATNDGQSGWQYVHPESVEQRQVAIRKEIEERQLSLQFPLRCRRIIDGQDILDEKRLVDLLEFAAGPLDRWSEEEAYLMGSEWTPRCGAAAVAVITCSDWLSRNSKWRIQCKAWLIEACRSAPLKLRPEPSLEGMSWSSFCAEALPVLWAREPRDKDLRRCMAYLVAAPHQDARRRFFATLARRRAEYPDDFGRLLHLAVRVARLVMLDPGPLPSRMASGSGRAGVEKVFLRLAEDFVSSRLAPLPGSWVEMSDERPKGLKMNPYGEHDGFHDGVLVESFAWLAEEAPDYQQACDRHFLQGLVEGLASVVPRRLSQSEDEEKEGDLRRVDPESLLVPIRLDQLARTNAFQQPHSQSRLGTFVSKIRRMANDGIAIVRKVGWPLRNQEPPGPPAVPPRRRRSLGTPWESDYNIAEMVALFLVREPDAAARRKLWEPWLRLGEPCHYWVDMLLDKIYLAAAQVSERKAVFCELMRDIFDHALADGGWLDGRSRRSHQSSDVARALLGFGTLVEREFWSAERAPAAIALRDYWPRWADAAMTWYGCADAFIRLLRTPAMGPLRPACLQWLLRSEPSQWISDDKVQMALVWLLELVWQERRDVGRGLTGPSRDVFERLLHELVTRRVADAVSLSGLVAREN